MTDQPRQPRPRPRRSSSGRATQSPRNTRARASSHVPREPASASAARARRTTPRPPQSRPGRRWPRLLALGAILLLLAALITGCGLLGISSNLPDPSTASARGRDQSTVIYDRHGRAVSKLFAEQDRTDRALKDIPPALRQAVIATEDRRFYEHSGVDLIGIGRALFTDIKEGSRAQGGSTITQQYVKQAFVTDEKTLKRKISEAMLARKLERKYTKDQILELYLNTIYFGRGAYGVEAASQAYFGKRTPDLTLPEAALLAGLIQSPNGYDPTAHPDAALKRRNIVLALMRDQDYISADEYQKAIATPIKLAKPKRVAAKAPYFMEWVRSQLIAKYGEDAVYRGGLRVYTTLDPVMQQAAERAIAKELDKASDPSAALVAIKPSTGEVLAMVGGRDFAKQQFNVAVQGKRQPGSAFKPFVLASALSDKISSEQTFAAGPARLKLPNGQTWKVTGASGVLRLRAATEKSVNSVFARLILKDGPEKTVAMAHKLGVTEDLEEVPAIALGGLEHGVSPLSMAAAYSTFADGGKATTPYAITKVAKPDGVILMQVKPQRKQALDPAVSFLVTDILRGVIARGTGHNAAIGRPAAGKTGTTEKNNDAWFVGYTPDLAAAVWMGYPDGTRPMKAVHGITVTGGSFPARIWASFMREALKGTPETAFKRPKGLKQATICLQTGLVATAYCPQTGRGLFLAGGLPKTCDLHATAPKVTIPNLVGMTKEAALAALNKLSIVYNVVEQEFTNVAAGRVADQSPKPGSVATSSTVVTVVVAKGSTVAPPAALITGPTTGAIRDKLTFDGSGSTSGVGIVSYLWSFGDGTGATGPTVTHRFDGAGTYQVTLRVTDTKGQRSSASLTVTIN
jgi:penicillin-binding protein 1A